MELQSKISIRWLLPFSFILHFNFSCFLIIIKFSFATGIWKIGQVWEGEVWLGVGKIIDCIRYYETIKWNIFYIPYNPYSSWNLPVKAVVECKCKVDINERGVEISAGAEDISWLINWSVKHNFLFYESWIVMWAHSHPFFVGLLLIYCRSSPTGAPSPGCVLRPFFYSWSSFLIWNSFFFRMQNLCPFLFCVFSRGNFMRLFYS